MHEIQHGIEGLLLRFQLRHTKKQRLKKMPFPRKVLLLIEFGGVVLAIKLEMSGRCPVPS